MFTYRFLQKARGCDCLNSLAVWHDLWLLAENQCSMLILNTWHNYSTLVSICVSSMENKQEGWVVHDGCQRHSLEGRGWVHCRPNRSLRLQPGAGRSCRIQLHHQPGKIPADQWHSWMDIPYLTRAQTAPLPITVPREIKDLLMRLSLSLFASFLFPLLCTKWAQEQIFQ